jgi:regulatory protein
MKVTSVEPQKKNSKRFNVFLDGQFGFGADEDLIVNFRLLPGKEIAAEDLDKLLFESEVGKLMERIYALLNIRERSEREIRDYLKRLNFKRKLKDGDQISVVAIENLIEKLKKRNLLNDLEFARVWIESRSKKLGINRIKQELYQKGIDRETIEEVISEKGEAIGSKEIVEKALEKKVNTWKNLDSNKFRKKAFDYLMRKGFEYETIKAVVESKLKELYNS